jgi:hypothetical protein
MVALLAFALFILPILYLYGKAVTHLIGAWFGTNPDGLPSFVLTALVGLVAVTFLATLLALFMPLSVAALAIVTTGALAILIWQLLSGGLRVDRARLRLNLPVFAWLLLAFVVVSVIEQATHKPTNPDSGIYHAQTIRWAETYPAVPGLGNIHGRLAFNSSWLVVQALVSFTFLGLRSFHMLPAIISMLVLLDWLRGPVGWLRGDASPVNILKTFLIPVFFYVLPSEVSSPGTDLPVVLLVWFLAAVWVERPRQDGSGLGIYDVSLLILILYAVTIKLSAAPLLILAVLAALGALRRPPFMAKLVILAVVFTAPWFARSAIQSGYLVYPVTAVDVFDLDWKIPPAEARSEQDAIVAFARLPRLERSEVMAMPANVWMRQWFANQTANRKLVLALAGISPFLLAGVVAVETLWRKRARTWTAGLIQVYLMALVGGIYWLFTAPDFRFGYGFLMLLVLLPLLLPAVWISRWAAGRTRFLPFVVVAGLILFQAVFLVRSFESKTFAERVWMPVDYPDLPTEPCALKDRRVMCSAPISYNECWYAPFPCIPFGRPEVELRGTGWEEGFRASTGRP